MNRSAEEGGQRVRKPTAMTFRQALLFIVYYTIFQLILVSIAGPLLHHFVGLDVTWKGLLFAFALLSCCGPVTCSPKTARKGI